MIRLSVSDLDTYRYWLDSEDELPELVARLTGAEPPSPAMLASRAFHKALETTQGGEFYSLKADGYEFVFAIEEQIAIPTVRELKGEVTFDTPSGPVTLVGKVDGLCGRVVNDYKLTERFEVERYADSLQWRSYLTMFNAHQFIYDVFVTRYDGPRAYIYDYHRLPLYSYPGMRDDVYREVAALAEIVAKHVPQKIQEAA